MRGDEPTTVHIIVLFGREEAETNGSDAPNPSQRINPKGVSYILFVLGRIISINSFVTRPVLL